MWTTSILFFARIILVLASDSRSEDQRPRFDNDTKLIRISTVWKWPDENNNDQIIQSELPTATTLISTTSTTPANRLISSIISSNSSVAEKENHTTTNVLTVAPRRTTTLPRLDEDVFLDQVEAEEDGDDGEIVDERERLYSPQPTHIFSDRTHIHKRNKESWFDRIKSFFKSSARNIMSHGTQDEKHFQEKYG